MTSSNRRSSGLFYFLMVSAMVCWGGSWVTAKWASAYPPAVTALWRFLLSSISFIPILAWRKEPFFIPGSSWLLVAASAALITSYNLLFLTAMRFGSGGYSGVLFASLNPLFSFILALLFTRLKSGAAAWAALLLGMSGGILQMSGPSVLWSSFASFGNFLLVCAALVYAALTHLSSQAQKKISVFQFSFWTSILCVAFLLPFTLHSRPLNAFSFGYDFWVNVLYLSFAAGTFATTMYFEAARRIGAAKGASFVFLVPVTALVLAFFVLSEIPLWTSLSGGVFSIIAVILIQRK